MNCNVMQIYSFGVNSLPWLLMKHVCLCPVSKSYLLGHILSWIPSRCHLPSDSGSPSQTPRCWSSWLKITSKARMRTVQMVATFKRALRLWTIQTHQSIRGLLKWLSMFIYDVKRNDRQEQIKMTYPPQSHHTTTLLITIGINKRYKDIDEHGG